MNVNTFLTCIREEFQNGLGSDGFKNGVCEFRDNDRTVFHDMEVVHSTNFFKIGVGCIKVKEPEPQPLDFANSAARKRSSVVAACFCSASSTRGCRGGIFL